MYTNLLCSQKNISVFFFVRFIIRLDEYKGISIRRGTRTVYMYIYDTLHGTNFISLNSLKCIKQVANSDNACIKYIMYKTRA